MKADDVRRVTVVGAGLMGHGIAVQLALRGVDVRLNDVSDESLERAIQNAGVVLETLHGLGLASEDDVRDVPGRIKTDVSLQRSVEDADLVIEAVFEDLVLKQSVFAELDRFCPPRTVLASNTSSFMASQLAPSTARPDKVVVANWWNPPYLLPLVEVVKGPETSDESISVLAGFLERIGKRPVVLQKESLGFIGNRMQFALLREAIAIVEQGIASPEDVDAVVKTSFGRRLAVAGPFEVFDLAGWDTVRAIIETLFPVMDSSTKVPNTIENMVQRGDLGLKSGKGFYPWTDEAAASLRGRVSEALATIERLSQGG